MGHDISHRNMKGQNVLQNNQCKILNFHFKHPTKCSFPQEVLFLFRFMFSIGIIQFGPLNLLDQIKNSATAKRWEVGGPKLWSCCSTVLDKTTATTRWPHRNKTKCGETYRPPPNTAVLTYSTMTSGPMSVF